MKGAALAFAIVVCMLIGLFVWDFVKRPQAPPESVSERAKGKLRENLVLDIRGANQYCLGYIALLGVMAMIAVNNRAAVGPLLYQLKLWPFGVAFIGATLSTLFIPAGYGNAAFGTLKVLWLRTIACEQIVVVLTGYGIWEVYRVLLAQLPQTCN